MPNKTLYTNVLGCLVKNGNKIKARKILNVALDDVSLTSNISVSKILYKLAKKIGNIVELKKVKIRKNIHLVPFPLKKNRRYFLLSKEITSSIKSNKKKVNSSEKLIEHMTSFLSRRGANFNKKKQFLKTIVFNRSNVHYRW